MNFWSKYALSVFFPAIFVVGSFLVAIVILCKKGSVKSFDDLQNAKILTCRITLVVVINLYTASVSAATSPFNCEQQPDGSFTLVKDPSIMCFGPEWMQHAWLVSLALLVYIVVIPLWMISIVRTRDTKRTTTDFRRKYDILLSPYRPCRQYWELLLMLKRSTFVLSISFFSGASYVVRFGAMISILFVFFWLTVVLSPYREESMNIFDASWGIVCMSILVAQGLVFETGIEGTIVLEVFIFFLMFFCFLFNLGRTCKILVDKKISVPLQVVNEKLFPAEIVQEICIVHSLLQLESKQELCLNPTELLATNTKRWISCPFKLEHQAMSTFLKSAARGTKDFGEIIRNTHSQSDQQLLQTNKSLPVLEVTSTLHNFEDRDAK
eukprot:TRINITY_DN14611_c0_g1_i4.p1 TRINITY_DN14611_c0_g1~~TRINITY_DN14611_c0_g1_i4.p1  ORF type:complete len:381 (+),score=63.96 TRINITY_DN14611_c0_g1_i4:83-1225(+)